VDVNFTVVPTVTIKTIPPGLPITVDGVLYPGTQTFAWLRETTHQISVGNPVLGLGSQYLFKNWSDGGAISHQIVAPQQAAQYTASLVEAFPLTTSVSPAAGGSITLNPPPTTAGLYPQGTLVQVQATPAAGMTFTGFRGDLTGTTNPQSRYVSSAKAVLASFESAGPVLYALAGAVDKSTSPVKVNISLVNSGRGAAVGARILRVANVQVLAGSGAVIPVGQTADLGFIAPGTSAIGAISFDWPATATRIRFTVEFGDSGTYRGSTTVSLFR
jgi:hypothetical protein